MYTQEQIDKMWKDFGKVVKVAKTQEQIDKKWVQMSLRTNGGKKDGMRS